MITPEAEQLYHEAVEYAESSGMRYSEAVQAVLDEKPMRSKKPNSAVLEAATKLDFEIHRLLAEEHVADYHEGMYHVLNSTDPRLMAIVRAYAGPKPYLTK